MDVAGERDHGAGAAALAGGHLAEQTRQRSEGGRERRPVVEVGAPPHPLPEPGRKAGPRAVAHRLVPALHVVNPAREDEGIRHREQDVVVLAAHPLHDPAPLVVVHELTRAGLEHAARAAVDRDEPCAAEVAAEAPARPVRLAVGAERELPQERPGVVGLRTCARSPSPASSAGERFPRCW